MWIPDYLYKLLPFFYVLAGAALFPIFGFSGPSVGSALLLLTAGILTALWRYKHQQVDKPAAPTARDQWEKRKNQRTESMPLDVDF
jgi:hypothetical protein